MLWCRHASARADLKDKVTIPDVLLQPHSASLGMTFYQGNNFPADYQGDAFAAEHGSWNRSKRTGYKVIRIRMKDGKPTGEYEDFVTGFVVNDSEVRGRPVGVAVAKDGALLISVHTMYRWDASYAVSVRKAHPDKFALIKPVDPNDPKVADTIADWAAMSGTVAIRIMMTPEISTDAAMPARSSLFTIDSATARGGCFRREASPSAQLA